MKRCLYAALLLIFGAGLLFSCGGGGGSDSNDSPKTPGTPPVTPEEPTPETPTAVDFLESQLQEMDTVLYVYKDYADGLNHFTQKMWTGDNDLNVPEMNEAGEACSGTSGIEITLDISRNPWGGYMFTNGVLEAGTTVPLASTGSIDAGLNLSGAQRLVFYAKGDTGSESVEFFMGGLGWQGNAISEACPDSTRKITLGVVQLTTEWQKFEISLEGADLSRVGCGFGWVANNVNNPGKTQIRFYVDDIRYEFAEPRMNPMFLQSYASVSPDDTAAYTINNFAYLYDNAAAAIALTHAGKHARARQIADAIVYAYEHDRKFSDGRLRNAYSSGNPASFPGWWSPSGKEFARIPGFYSQADKAWYEDFYADSTSTGNLAWAVLALCEVFKNAPEGSAYLKAATGIGDLILTLKDQNGGFTGGFEGFDDNSVQVTYKSTEHNIDLISVFAQLEKMTGETKYGEAAEHARAFVLSMYDPDKGCFYTGTAADGVTPNTDVLPLDANTWAILALQDAFDDGEKVMEFVENHMAVNEGYDFNEDQDGVWFEGTAQVAVVCLQLGNVEKYNQILSYLKENTDTDGSITATDRDGVSTGFDVGGTTIPWEYGKRRHVGATAWLAFAELGVNPFAVEK